MPEELRRDFILSGYRTCPFESDWAAVARSLARVHNETGNIATHALHATLFTALFFADRATAGPPNAFKCAFFAGAVAMGAASAAYHLARAKSPAAYRCCYVADLAGVVLTIAGSFAWGLSLVFYCDRRARNAYCAVSTSLCAALLAVAAVPRLRADWSLVLRSFVAVVAFAPVPIAHGVLLGHFACERQPFFWGLAANIAMVALFGAGAALLVSRWPERSWPGRFDYWLHSHQLWHACVTAATLVQYAGHANAERRYARLGCAVTCS